MEALILLVQDGVIDVHDIKRTHRQKDFNAVQEVREKNFGNSMISAMYDDMNHGKILIRVGVLLSVGILIFLSSIAIYAIFIIT